MDKEKKKFGMIALFVILLFSVCMLPEIRGNASAYLDQIEQETIEVEIQEDGSAVLTYDLDWKVLDSTSEGALTWVKIGIPNEYVEDLTALSDSIEEIGYYGSGGDYVRLDLDREYEAGEVVNLKFSIHQHCLYEENEESYLYEFTPGWFEEIPVDQLTIHWTYDEYTTSDMERINLETEDAGNSEAGNSDVVYQSVFRGLHPGEKVKVRVIYPKPEFQFQDEYEENTGASSKVIVAIMIVLSVFGPGIYVLVLFFRRNSGKPKDHYERNRGMESVYMGSGSGRHHHRSGGCACACACACASAGGGRAGCSRKNFFHIKIKRNRTRKELRTFEIFEN